MAEWFDVECDLGGNRLGLSGNKHTFDRWCRPCAEPKPPCSHADHAPSPGRKLMRRAQPSRHRDVVPERARADVPKSLRQLSPIAERTVDRCPAVTRPTSRIEHPRADLERWSVTEMLAVTARELSDPLSIAVLVVPGDRPFHAIHAIRATEERTRGHPRRNRALVTGGSAPPPRRYSIPRTHPARRAAINATVS